MSRAKGKTKNRKVKQSKPRKRKDLKKTGSSFYKKLASLLVFIVIAGAIGAGGGMLVRLAYNTLTTAEQFAIKKITVSGNQRVSRSEILERSGLQTKDNIFGVDLENAVRNIKSHPWIKGVTVKREFPDGLMIHVLERDAAAILRRDGMKLMDASGEIFKNLAPNDPLDLPVVTAKGGKSANVTTEVRKKALKLINMAEKSGIMPAEGISEIIITPGGMKMLGTGSLRYVNFGDADISESWHALEMVIADARRSGAEVVGVDLRYKKGAAVRLKTDPKTMVADGRGLSADESK